MYKIVLNGINPSVFVPLKLLLVRSTQSTVGKSEEKAVNYYIKILV